MDDTVLLETAGLRIATRSGRPVVLRGVGLGGWMNMENFITGYPATETLQRAALRRALGEESYARFFDRFLDVFFADEDAAFIASLGLNHVRLPVSYRHFEDDMRPFELREGGFRLLDRAIDRCARHGLYAIIDLHALPGAQNQRWHSDNPTHRALFWTHRHFQDRVVNLWEALARRYRNNPWVAGYNPINEPGDVSGAVIGPFYRRLHDAVRAIDPDHILFLEGNRYSVDFDMFGDPWPNTVYSVHDYALPGLVDGGDYPGVSRGRHVDRDVIEQTFRARTAYMRKTETPIWVGEFGPVYTGDARRDAMRFQVLVDQLDLYRRHDASWALWTYKDIGLQGLVYASPDSPYLRRIRSVLEKKARLGVDAWGSSDAGVRDILEPIEETFGREFPGFDPFPFGPRSWIHGLVRHILLAEPLVDEFARCFEGVGADEAAALADSFRFETCLKRDRLLDILRAAASVSQENMSAVRRGAIVVTKERFAEGMTVRQYIEQMSTNKERFLTALDSITITPEDIEVLQRLAGTRKIVVLTEDWCGASLASLPFVVKLVEGMPRIEIRIFLRDENPDLMDQFLKDGRYRSIPVFAFFDEHMSELARFIERRPA